MRDDSSEEGCGVEVVMGEGVGLAVETEIVWLLDAHEVDGVGSQTDEDDLHHEHVERLPPQEQVDVATHEDCEEELLRAVGQPCVGGGVPMTFLLAMILSSSMRTAMTWRKSPISWNRSITW